MSIQVRATIRLHNYDMIHARKSLGLTMVELSERTGIHLTHIYDIQAFRFKKRSASRKTWIARGEAIADVLMIDPETVVPPEMLDRCIEPIVRIASVEPASLVELSDRLHDGPLELASSVQQSAIDVEMRQRLDGMLSQLTDRQELVVRARYGLGVPKRTLASIGKELNRTQETIRQIEAKSVRDLRDIDRSRAYDGMTSAEDFIGE